MIKISLFVTLALTSPVLLLILISRFRKKPLKSCGAACDCIDGNSLELGL